MSHVLNNFAENISYNVPVGQIDVLTERRSACPVNLDKEKYY